MAIPAMTFGRRRTAAFKALKCWIFWKLIKQSPVSLILYWYSGSRGNLQETEKQSHALKGGPYKNYHKTHACECFIAPHRVWDQRWAAMLLL